MKILIVDDNYDDRKLLRQYLEHNNCEVIEAEDGLKGLEKAYDLMPDLIISDALMPRMDGFQFLRNIKQDARLSKIPFVFYSAVYTGQKEMDLAMALGAEKFIVKPKDPDEFWNEISKILEQCQLKERKSEPLYNLLFEDEEYLKQYIQIVAQKLEEKVRELENTKRELIEINAKLEHLLSYAPAILYDSYINYPYKISFVSNYLKTLTGYNSDEVLKDENFWLNHIHLEDRDNFLENMKNIINNGYGEIEYRFLCKDGSYKWLHNVITVVRDMEEKILGSIVDITEKKVALIQLQKSEEKYKKLSREFKGFLDAVPDMILLLDKQLKIEWINQTVEKITGRKADELIGKVCYKELFDYVVHCERCPVFETIETKKPSQEIITTLDGKVWDVRAVPIFNEKGEMVNIIEVSRDITEHRKMEEQIRQTQKLESIGHFAGGIAHDFNNILSAILGFANLIQMQITSDNPINHYIEQIISATQRGADLTRQILAFGRKQILDKKPININSLIRNLSGMLRRILREDINLNLDLCEDDAVVLVDSVQLDQVLLNLSSNARDAMPNGGVLDIKTEIVNIDESFIKLHGYGTEGRYIRISVSDTGMGMNKETLQRIFEPFFTTKELGKGTGLGLSVVYGIIKQHNGFINCYSEEGKGTTFNIYLPISREIKKIEEDKRTIIEELEGRGTILIVEDDSYTRESLIEYFQIVGFKVYSATNGEEAVMVFKDKCDEIDLVLLDTVLPKKSGKEVYSEIKLIKPDIKVLFMSGYPADIIHEKGILDKTIDFIQKPTSPLEFLRKVREILKK